MIINRNGFLLELEEEPLFKSLLKQPMKHTKIEWTDRTWNPLRGCSKVSDGCKNCYAMSVAHRFSGEGMPYEGLTKIVACKPEWTNKIMLLDDKVREPFHWKKPAKIFVNSMSDLFHDDVPFEFIYKVFETMFLSYWHTFQVLTKRPARMAKLVPEIIFHLQRNYKVDVSLKNIWLGTSVEDQKTADERIPFLLKTPVASKFLSMEPLLGAVDIVKYIGYMAHLCKCGWHETELDLVPNGRRWRCTACASYSEDFRAVSWVIVGGESGNNARPMHPDWVRSLRDQCVSAQVKFFFKQWGEYLPFEESIQPPYFIRSSDGEQFDGHGMNMVHPETGDPGSWCGGKWMDMTDATIYCMETKSEHCSFLKLGKKAAGRLLDGVEYDAMPEVN